MLREKQFEILPYEDAPAGSGFIFGIGADVSVNGEGFKPGATEWLTQRGQNTRRGVTSYGRDVLAGPVWSWESHVDQQDVQQAVEVLEEFTSAWRPLEVMETPSALTTIRYMVAGRIRRVYGRPEALDAPPTNLIDQGFVALGHEFKCVDAFTYADEVSTLSLAVTGGVDGGGFKLPQRAPIKSIAPIRSEGNSNQAAVLGTARSYPIIRFNGPWNTPTLTCEDWTLRLEDEIGENEYIEVDTRPWHLTVLKNGTTSVANKLGRRVWLEDIYMRPKSRPTFTLGGRSHDSGATCDITWRNAWNNI